MRPYYPFSAPFTLTVWHDPNRGELKMGFLRKMVVGKARDGELTLEKNFKAWLKELETASTAKKTKFLADEREQFSDPLHLLLLQGPEIPNLPCSPHCNMLSMRDCRRAFGHQRVATYSQPARRRTEIWPRRAKISRQELYSLTFDWEMLTGI